MLQIPCLEAESISDCSEEYEFLLYLLNHMHKNMKTIEQLKKEVAASLKQSGATVDYIAQVTKLSAEEIEKL